VLPPFNVSSRALGRISWHTVAGVEIDSRLIFSALGMTCSDFFAITLPVTKHSFHSPLELRHFLSRPFPLNLVTYDHPHTAEF
jgi:hypothetical protein